MPAEKEEGIAQLIYPTAREKWINFNPEDYKDKPTYNLNPEGWASFNTKA
jgi:hypothetical protein